MQSMWREDLKKGMTPFQFFIFSSRPYLPWIIGAFVCVIMSGVLEASISYFFKNLIDTAGGFSSGEPSRVLWQAAGLFLGIFALDILIRRVAVHWNAFLSTGARATARYALSSYVTLHSTQFFGNRFAGSISSKISTASGNMRQIGNIILWNFTGLFVILATSIFILSTASTILALILVGWVIVVVPVNAYFARKRTSLSSAAQAAETLLSGSTVDILTNIFAVQDYANRDLELSQLRKLTLDRRSKGLRNWRYGNFIVLINSAIQMLFISGLLLVSIHLLTIGKITPGDIALVLSLVVIVQGNLHKLAEVLGDFAEAWGELKEGLEEILIEQEMPDKKDARPLSTQASSITFDEMSFTYGKTAVFDTLSLVIPQGQKVGLVGRSGAGKSTLVKLLLRHYDLSSGSIRIGDENIAEVTKDSLRRAIAVVPQEPILFHRSIRDNIAYGKPDATMEEVVRAATLAEAHEFIEKVSGGYNALVGERGVKLSGGQRQRIVIARAILKDAPILLLDEATSALDSESEGAVQKALFTLMERRTVIAIAHRLSTLRMMDRIIVMDEGKIIEDGTHNELLVKDGVYAMLWNHQAGGFIEE